MESRDPGAEFKKALGGNYPVEEFTIIMLTYKRERVLRSALARLKRIPYLNKVIVIWNSPGDPSSNMSWPNVGVPVKVSNSIIVNGQFPFQTYF